MNRHKFNQDIKLYQASKANVRLPGICSGSGRLPGASEIPPTISRMVRAGQIHCNFFFALTPSGI